MRIWLLAILLLALNVSAVTAASIADATGVIRVFGDSSSWMSACFVIGDGSWAVTSYEAVIEKVGPQVERLIRYPVFISSYTGQAWQCEVKFYDADLGIALLKLPVKGLPAAPLARMEDVSKAAYGTMGQLMSGEKMGNAWPSEILAVTREKNGNNFKLTVGQWNAKKSFVTDIGKFKWMFISDISPEKPVPNGAMLVREDKAVGMYLSRMVITGGKEDIIYGRCAMSTEIARFLGDRSIDSASLYSPPKATIERKDGADAVFQLQARIYTFIGAGAADAALDATEALVKMRPEDPQAQMVHGLALTAAGKFEDALKAYDEAAKADPKLPALKMNRALALLGLEKVSEAEAELIKAAEEVPSDARPVTALADFYLSDEKTYDKAMTWAQKATNMDPKSPAAKLLLARVLKRTKKYQEAANTIGEALKMAPDWGEAWYALGATYEEAGDKALAEKAFRTLVEKQPQNPDSLMTLASFLADIGKKDDALETLGKVRELKPPKEVMEAAQALEDRINGKEQPTNTDAPKPQ